MPGTKVAPSKPKKKEAKHKLKASTKADGKKKKLS